MHLAALALLGLVCTEHNQHSSRFRTGLRIRMIRLCESTCRIKYGRSSQAFLVYRSFKPLSSTLLENKAVFVRLSFPACVRRFPQPQYVVSASFYFLNIQLHRSRRGVGGSSRPENCPVDSFQQRTGGSPGHSESPHIFIYRKAPLTLPHNLLSPTAAPHPCARNARKPRSAGR